MLLNNQQITEEIKICIEMNENENTTIQNLWDTIIAVLRWKFIALQAYCKKQEKSQINNLTLHLNQLEKEEMKNPKARFMAQDVIYPGECSVYTWEKGEIHSLGVKFTVWGWNVL